MTFMFYDYVKYGDISYIDVHFKLSCFRYESMRLTVYNFSGILNPK